MSTGSRIVWPTASVSPGLDEIAAAELVGRQPDRGGDLVHVPLEREEALRRAEAAERAVRRHVGRDRASAHAHVGARVRPRRVDRPARQDDRRQRAVGAAVDGEVDVHREQAAVARRPPCDAASATGAAWSSTPCLRRGRRSSSPAAPTSTRAAPRARRSPTGYSSLPPKPPPVSICTTRMRSSRQVEEPGERVVDVVRALHRSPHGDAVLRIGDREHAVRLDVELLLRAASRTPLRRRSGAPASAASTSPFATL